jgi:hypothetical protein
MINAFWGFRSFMFPLGAEDDKWHNGQEKKSHINLAYTTSIFHHRCSNFIIMGMCMCTMVSFPISSCVGCTIATIISDHDSIPMNDNDYHETIISLRNFAIALAAGFVCYIALTIQCARSDGDKWTFIRNDGECWSEGGDMPFIGLGLVTGALLGIGLFGTLIMAYTVLQQKYSIQNNDNERDDMVTGNYNQVVELPGVGV